MLQATYNSCIYRLPKSHKVLLQSKKFHPDSGYSPQDTAVDIILILINIPLLYGGPEKAQSV